MKTLAGIYSPVQDISSSLHVSVLQGRLWALKARSDSKSSHSVQKQKHEKAGEPSFLLSLLGGKDKENSLFFSFFFSYDNIPFPEAMGTLVFSQKKCYQKTCSSGVKSCAL